MNYNNINKQIIFTCLVIAFEFSITNVDFFFLEKVSYLASIGVSGLMALLYLSQYILTLFAQSMVTNATYFDLENKKEFSKHIGACILISIGITCIMALLFLTFKNNIINSFHISEGAKTYASTYLTYMVPFLFLFGIQQYFTYVIYTLGLAKLNLLIIILIVSLNTIFDYTSTQILHLGVAGIALASACSIICVLPIYYSILAKHKVAPMFFAIDKELIKKLKIGMQKLGFYSFIEPVSHYALQFAMFIFISLIAQEMMSGNTHAHNFLTFAITFSLACGIIIQIQIVKLYAKGRIANIKKLYANYLKISLLFSLIISLISTIFIYFTIDFYSSNNLVKKYIIICMLLGLFIEPMRALSIVSRSYLRGLQYINFPLTVNLLGKIFIFLPLYYISVHFTNFGIFAILFLEGLSYLFYFMVNSIFLHWKIKELEKKEKNNIKFSI